MDAQTDIATDRRRRQVAASYRKQGYRVTTPAAANGLPDFLGDCHPDLIAERDDDHVVIEVKPQRALKGSNHLIKLAERVAAEPGWRLEFAAVKGPDTDTTLLAPDWLERMLQPVAPGADDTLTAVYLVEVLGYLLRAIALRNKLRLRDRSPRRVMHELAFAGVIDEPSSIRIEDALTWRDEFMHGLPVPPASAGRNTELQALCRDLHARAQHPED